MDALPFTLVPHRVKDGREADFVRAWNGLADTFSSLQSPPFGDDLQPDDYEWIRHVRVRQGGDL